MSAVGVKEARFKVKILGSDTLKGYTDPLTAKSTIRSIRKEDKSKKRKELVLTGPSIITELGDAEYAYKGRQRGTTGRMNARYYRTRGNA